MEDPEKQNSVDYWKRKAHLYETLFSEQQEICDGYREIIEDQEHIIGDLKSKIYIDKNHR